VQKKTPTQVGGGQQNRVGSRVPTTDRQRLLELPLLRPHLIPVGTEKRPIGSGWQQPDRLYSDKELLESPAVGLRLGYPILAVDFDPKPDNLSQAEQTFQQLTGHGSHELPRSWTVSSGKPGRRQVLLLVHQAPWLKPWSRDGLEIRWLGQQSVIDGHHPETGRYSWLRGMAPWECPLAAAPDWLLDSLKSPRERVRQQLHPPTPADLPTRSEADLLAALERVPEFLHDQGRRQELLGLAQRLTVEWGLERAHQWLAQHSPTIKDLAGYFSSEPDRISTGSIWPFLNEHYGVDLKRHDLTRSSPKGSPAEFNARQQDPTRGEVQQRTYSELLVAMLAATIAGDDDELMGLRAETMARFRLSDAQVEAALFKLHTQREVGGKATQAPESLDLSRISGMDWLIEGFIPDNDQTLLWGNGGSGKTTAALAAACAVLRGTGLLDHSQPAPRGGVLFIASDSGAPPLYAAMQDMGLAEMPEVQDGPQKLLHVWASDPDQGMTAWAADLRGCIRLLEFIQQHGIRLVLIDSCKAVCSGAGLDYTNNQLVTALLTYFKEVICPHTAVVWLNHDGTARGAHAGAKAWKEIPSMVHSIIREQKKDGSLVNNRRLWRVVKSRMGPTREFYYELSQGELKLCPNQEKVGNCLARVVDVLMRALQEEGRQSLTKSELIDRICTAGGASRKTLNNTLSTATRARHPEVCRADRGRYKLAPRIADSLKGCILNGKEHGQNPVTDRDLSSSRQVPMGTSQEPENFPVGINGKSPDCSAGLRSGQVPSRNACTPYQGVMVPGSELVEIAQAAPVTGSGADAFGDEDDPAWGPPPAVA
jgi:hypothetical protein